MRNCSESVVSVPGTVVASVRAEGVDMSAVSELEDTWDWRGVKVPVIRDFWSANTLTTTVIFLLWKHSRGGSVGLQSSSMKEDVMLRRWLYAFGSAHTVLWFDKHVTFDGLLSQRKVSIGMFLWAVRCEVIGESDLCAHMGEVGSFLFRLVKVCHGPGLVDPTVISFLRYVVGCACICLIVVFET